MTRFNIKKRDGLARTGTFQVGDTTLNLPAAVDSETVFPDLDNRDGTNIPLCAPPALVKHYPPPITDNR